MTNDQKKQGFTLIELIIVIAIIAILAAMIFVAIDPARRLHEARNATRASDIATILEAVKLYQVDNDGTHYSTVANLANDLFYQIGTAGSGCAISCGIETTQSACVNLSGIGTNYLGAIPYDPSVGTFATSHYSIKKDSNGAVTVQACDAEGEGPGGDGTPPTIWTIR